VASSPDQLEQIVVIVVIATSPARLGAAPLGRTIVIVIVIVVSPDLLERVPRVRPASAKRLVLADLLQTVEPAAHARAGLALPAEELDVAHDVASGVHLRRALDRVDVLVPQLRGAVLRVAAQLQDHVAWLDVVVLLGEVLDVPIVVDHADVELARRLRPPLVLLRRLDRPSYRLDVLVRLVQDGAGVRRIVALLHRLRLEQSRPDQPTTREPCLRRKQPCGILLFLCHQSVSSLLTGWKLIFVASNGTRLSLSATTVGSPSGLNTNRFSFSLPALSRSCSTCAGDRRTVFVISLTFNPRPFAIWASVYL